MTPASHGFFRGCFLFSEAKMNKQTRWQRLIADELDAPSFEKWNIKRAKSAPHPPEHRIRVHDPQEVEFRCILCKRYVSTGREASGVNNRNHCPWCLHSRHVDLKTPGDRLADCHSKMAPIGLTFKRTPKKYGRSFQGELMLIHRCAGCGRISINRIASDDDPHALFKVFTDSSNLSTGFRDRLIHEGITLLDAGNRAAVFSQLFGWQGIVAEFAPGNKVKSPLLVEEE
jgi:DNA-directed RNA polymerase subunit RPC12/RpoP